MSLQMPLTLINPLHRERCIVSLPHGGVCPESIDFTKRVSAHLKLALSKPESKPETRAINFRNAARLMICDNHENRLREARGIARRWEEQAAQQSNALGDSLASTEFPTYCTSSLHNRRYRPNLELCASQ
ncbi:hypothetical protein BJX66DRAFT_350026 [Aspergillus keveii]|uniref:Uncharacterized protein n=1 Tax=Aspergillus keveii TaxID=714993 RepID=A0ABR4FIV6_9EURO